MLVFLVQIIKTIVYQIGKFLLLFIYFCSTKLNTNFLEQELCGFWQSWIWLPTVVLVTNYCDCWRIVEIVLVVWSWRHIVGPTGRNPLEFGIWLRQLELALNRSYKFLLNLSALYVNVPTGAEKFAKGELCYDVLYKKSKTQTTGHFCTIIACHSCGPLLGSPGLSIDKIGPHPFHSHWAQWY